MTNQRAGMPAKFATGVARIDRRAPQPRGRLRPASQVAEASSSSLVARIVIVVYTALWAVTLVDLPMVGRIEKPLVILGVAAIPFALNASRLVTVKPPLLVSIGLIGVVLSYLTSFLLNPPAFDGMDFVLGLTGRAVFLWVAYVLLQDRRLLRQAFWLLTSSSVVIAALAVLAMYRNGIGFGRLSGDHLADLLSPLALAIFGAVQSAPVGAVLLLGVTSTLSSRQRRWIPLAAFMIFLTAYLSYFRREFLFSIPILLVGLQLSSTGTTRAVLIRRAVLLAVGLVVAFGWEYSRSESVLGMRMASEIGGFISADESRVTTAWAQGGAILERPVVGYGAGNHARAIAPYAPPSEIYLAGFNIYGWLAVEGGLFCLLSYLLILLGVWLRAWRYRALPGASIERVVLRCSPALMLQIVMWGVFGNSWEITLAWFVMGMILAAARLVEIGAGVPLVYARADGLRRGVRQMQNSSAQ